MKARSTRARPMAAADRRKAIVDAAVPLLLRKGASFTTAEVAQAADIAEGTIFRAFPDKTALLFESARAALDPASLVAGLRAIDPRKPVEQVLAEAANLLREHLSRMTALGETMRSAAMQAGCKQGEVSRLVREASAHVTAALLELLNHHRDALRVEPSVAVTAFRGLVIASAHPMVPPRDRLSTADVVEILLAGVGAKARRH